MITILLLKKKKKIWLQSQQKNQIKLNKVYRIISLGYLLQKTFKLLLEINLLKLKESNPKKKN